MLLKAYMDSSLTLDVVVEQVKSTEMYSFFTSLATAHFRRYSCLQRYGQRVHTSGSGEIIPEKTGVMAQTLM